MQRCRVRTNRVNVLGGGYAVTGIRQWGLNKKLFLHGGGEDSSGVGKYTSALSVFATTVISSGREQ